MSRGFHAFFAAFADSELPRRLHEALIEATQQDRPIGHISRDWTEIEVREKPVPAPGPITASKPTRKRGRPKTGVPTDRSSSVGWKKGEQPPALEPTRLERQTKMTLEEMLDELPKACGVGAILCSVSSR
jgi:hypothetical protein